ncbi:hypothetical protein BIZ37_24525 [Photobacterium sp. BZF1]|uniref:DUF6559 family protein n=1 Tax=Photobacterium sp. BZF1 TaxID=1904457 RepID=UPI001653D715|nr:DUF6559 family protein [Photobacterium sp. BZF1]MBC7005729.1 hypothetical protein [Photobacterium sp. BZF1]
MLGITQLFKRRAIRQYIKAIGPTLLKSYGPREAYSEGQIVAVLEQSGLSQRYQQYAYALFGDQYPELRQELAEGLFGNTTFTALDIIALAKPAGWKGGTNNDNLSNHYGQNSRY